MPYRLNTYVGKSAIHGKGLFASRTIKKDSVIGYLEGSETDQDGMYVLWVDPDTRFEVTCKLKYINHSDEPNACYYDDKSVVALRDIQPDEEITHNYEANW